MLSASFASQAGELFSVGHIGWDSQSVGIAVSNQSSIDEQIVGAAVDVRQASLVLVELLGVEHQLDRGALGQQRFGVLGCFFAITAHWPIGGHGLRGVDPNKAYAL